MNRNMKKLLAGLLASTMYFGSGIQPMANVMMMQAEEAEEKGYNLEDAIEPVRTIDGLEGFEETIFAPTELAWQESQEVLEDGQHVRLSVSIEAEEDESVISVRKPDGTVEEGASASYDAPCNGLYEFEAVYEKDGEERTEMYYVIVFGSSRMEDGNRPSKANGFMPVEGSVSPLMNEELPTGNPQYKLMQDNVTVDGETFGRGYRHYIAYITMWNEGAGRNDYVMCLDPHKTLSDSITDYDGELIEYGQNKWIDGKKPIRVQSNDLALIWFYCTQYGELYGNAEGGFSFSAYDWYFLCQLMIWDKLGYPVDWGSTDSEYARARDWAENLIGGHEEMMSPDADKMMEVWENAPWGAGIETVYGTGGTCEQQGTQMKCTGGYLSMDGKVNEAEGQWVRFDPKTTVHSFGDPKNVSGKFNVTFKEVENEPGNPANGTHKEIDAIEGGSIWIRHCDEEKMDKYSFSYERMSRNIDIRTKGKSEGFNSYEFVRTGHLQDVETVPFVWGNDWVMGNSAYFKSSLHEQEGAPQPIMNFRLGFNDEIPLMFSEQPNAEVPDVQEKPQPKELEAPFLEKRDSEDKFPVEGAEFTFHAGETYKLHYVWTKEVEVWRCTGSGDDEVCDWEAQDPTEGKKSEIVWSQGDEVMNSETTPSDGRIDTTPIIQNYYDEYDALWNEIQEEYAEKSANESSDRRNVTYTVELDPEYTDKEGEGWVGGRFYAKEPHTSQNTCNSDPSGNGTCNPDFDGYLNLHKWEKISFEIKEKTGGNDEPLVIYHDNDRQKGRFTIHKVDGEDEYLNHNNSHEAQGDGYFYGSVFVVTARKDIVLHDGSIPDSDFTGNPLVKGEVADVLVLQLPKKDDGTYDYEYLDNLSTSTTMMLELGKYAIQEVRWPGVYQEDLPLIYDRNDGLWHVDPAQADDVLAKLKDKDSVYYRFDYEKASELYENGILPIDSPDGGYWFKDYVNGIANTTNAGFIGGQTIGVDIKYVGEDSAYNEVVPHGTLDDLNGERMTIQGEEVSHTLPMNYASPDVEDTVAVTVDPDLDYANSIQKGHIQFKKILTEAPGIDGNNDNTGVDSGLNIAGKDIYFAIYLDRKTGSLIQDSTKKYELVDKYFASERLDGLKYVYDAVGNFELYAEDDPTSSVTGYHKASAEEIRNGLGLVMVSVDGSTTGMKPADNYIKWEMREMSDDITASIKVNTYVNPYYNNIALNNQNLSDKELYMILRTDNQGLAGTNMPHTIVWANYAALDNTANANHYGEWNYNVGSSYSKAHAEVLDYLHKNGLPLPYGSYTIVEMNAPQGYEGVSWKAQVSKNLTTYDINEDETVWELGIENSTEKYLSGNQNPQGWTSQQASVDGDGHAEDQTWLNKQFHIFSDYVSTSRYVGENIEDKLHRQILEIVKVDKETGKMIAYDSASFKVWQWNPMLDLNDSWKQAVYNNQTKDWEITYVVPEVDGQGDTVSVKTYQGTDWYTDSKGISAQLGQWIVIPANGTGIYTTGNEGKVILSQPLPPADYFLLETKAPEGYLLHKQPIPFSIEVIGGTTEPNEGDSIAVPVVDEEGNFVCKAGKDCNNPESPDYALDKNGEVVLENCEWQAVPQYVTITITAEDMPQKGYVEVEKRGSIFDKFVQYVTDFVEMIGFKPTWKEDEAVKLNTTFCIYAREDIVVNGEVKFEKDECIQKMDTTDEGHAYSEALYLGKYYVKECDAPHGYITSGEEMDFELAYDEQTVTVHPDFKEFPNERQKFNIHLSKSDEEGNPLEGAVFGIFAGEDLPKGIQHEDEPEKTGNETLTMDEMDVSLNGEWQNVCKETETGIVCDSTFVGEKTAVLNAVATDKERFSVPDHVTIDGEEFELTTIGAYAFMNCDAKAITLPATITTVKDYAFARNDELEYLQFLGETAPSFTSNVFPTGHELLGIYIPWSALSIYDLALVDGMADNNGSKDQRLMGIPLKDGNLLWNEDPEFNQNPFDTEGFANLGKVENTKLPYDEAIVDFELEYKTKTITLENGNTAKIEGYFITGYKGTGSVITVPEIVFNSPEGYEQRIVGLDAEAFSGDAAETILVPDSIQYIGKEAFADNEALTAVRFYETEYREYADEEDSGLETDDDMQMNQKEEICNTSGGTWTEQEDGSFACKYVVPTEKETSEEECASLGGTYTEGICSYDREATGEMPEPNLDAGMSVAEMIVGRRFLLVGIGEGAETATPNDTEKSNSQIACEANGGTWNETLGTCSGGESEVEETLDGGFDIGYELSNSQKACEAMGGTWNDVLGKCLTADEPFEQHTVYIAENAFDYTPTLTWIVAGEKAWYSFDIAMIMKNDKVATQDGDRDGSLWWNPEAVNPQTGKPGYWELGTDKPALLGYPITINRLTDNEDPIDPGIQGPDGSYLPSETTGIKADTLIEVIKTDINGHANTQFDYPEGNYYVRELKAPEGYEISRETYPIELIYQENDEPMIDIYANDGEAIVNYKKENYPLRIDIYKVDEDTLKGLIGAEFQLWNYERTTVLETLVTDSTGHAVTKGLYDIDANDGHYWLKETKAPAGYEIIGDGWTEVTVDADASSSTTLVVVKNKPEKPEKPHTPGGGSSERRIKIQLIKSLEKDILFGDEEAWKHVEFGIFAAEDIYGGTKRNPKLVYEADEMIFSSGIDENGIFNVVWKDSDHDIENGKYYVQEISTSKDYVLNDHKYYFEVDEDRDGSLQIVEINDLKPIVNELKRTRIKVMKIDRYTKESLPGAKMGIYATYEDARNDTNALEYSIADDEGNAYFYNCPNGTYYVKEVDAPFGYQVSDEIVTAEITGSHEDNTYVIVYTNVLLPGGGGNNPPTGDGRRPVLVAAVGVLSASMAFFCLKKKKNEKI